MLFYMLLFYSNMNVRVLDATHQINILAHHVKAFGVFWCINGLFVMERVLAKAII